MDCEIVNEAFTQKSFYFFPIKINISAEIILYFATMETTLEEIFGAEFAAGKNIAGAVNAIDTAEESRLWEESPIFPPARQVAWLDHFVALEWHLSRLQAGWVSATPSLLWRMEMPRFLFEDMQHVKELRARREEYAKSAEPAPPAPRIAAFLTAIAEADSAASFYGQLFAQVKPAILAAYRTYLEKCDPIADGPTVYQLERIIWEKERQLTKAREIMQADPLTPANADEARAYESHVAACIAALGTLTPEFSESAPLPANPTTAPAGPTPAKEVHDPRLRISERFPQSKEDSPVHGSLREIVYHMATEWQVIGPMCCAYYELDLMPLEFFIDFSRHIWDECRHAQIGHRRLRELGFSTDDFIWPAPADRPESAQSYVASLTLVGEACSFKRKQGSIIPFLRRGDHPSALLPSIDCVDERQHVTYGAKWVPEIYKRYNNDHRPLRDIATETRSSAMAERDLLAADEPQRRQVSSRLPLFCSAIEFSNLNFTKY